MVTVEFITSDSDPVKWCVSIVLHLIKAKRVEIVLQKKYMYLSFAIYKTAIFCCNIMNANEFRLNQNIVKYFDEHSENAKTFAFVWPENEVIRL